MTIRGALLALGATILVASCQVGQQPGATSPTATAPLSATPPVTASPTLQLTTPVPTLTPAATIDPCASSTADDPARPPDAYLSPAGGGEAVKGSLGSYTYCDTAADALPPRAENLESVPLGDPPTVPLSIPAGEGVTAYRAGYWPASEWQGDEVRYSSDELAAPSATAAFDGPPAGDWMLAVHLTFAGGGNAVYYWHVTVP